MKRTLVAVSCVILAGGSLALLAQSSGQKSLAATLNVAAFPQAGQNAQQQSQDEAACYQWAVQNTGVDPFDAQKKAEAQATRQAQSQGQQAQQVSAQQIEGFKKAFCACLEGKKYIAKY